MKLLSSKSAFKKIYSTMLVLGMLASLGFWSSQAEAQNRSSINLSPLLMEMEIMAGKTYGRQIKISNANAVDYEVSVEVSDVDIDPDTHNVKFYPEESKYNEARSLAAWVKAKGAESFKVPAGATYLYFFEVDVPGGVESADYFASLNFYYRPIGEERGLGNVQVRQSLGTLLLVNVRAEGEAASLHGSADYEISKLVLNYSSEETEVRVDFFNNALSYAHLKSVITISDDSGEIYYQKEGAGKRVFPGERAEVEQTFPSIYLAAIDDLNLNFALWDRQGKKKYYEEEVKLTSFQQSLEVLQATLVRNIRWVLLTAIVVLLVVIVIVARRKKNRLRFLRKVSKPQGRKKRK